MGLRYYQEEAVQAIFDYWSEEPGNPLVDMATGTGKSITAATVAHRLVNNWQGMRVVGCTHVIELVEGNYKELLGIDPFAPAGVYAASMGMRDSRSQILFVQLQTVWNKAQEIGHVDVLMIDEVQLVPPEADTMYGVFIDALLAINPDMKIVGFSATLFRLDSGRLDEGDNRRFDKVVYTYGLRRGIDDGYLCSLTSKPTETRYDLSGVGKAMGEYKAGEYARAVDTADLNSRVVEEVLDVEGHRNKALIFCRGIEHATHMRDAFRAAGRSCEVVSGKTPKAERRKIIEALKAGEIWGATNDNVLSTGTNIVGIDLIVDTYKTLSAGRYAQRAGRGTRVVWPRGFDPESTDAAGRIAAIAGSIKPNCRYMDFAGNIQEHGPVDMIDPKRPSKGDGTAPIKICPSCEEIVHASARLCTCCGHEFEFDATPKFMERASDAPIISTVADWRTVTGRRFSEHQSKDPAKPNSVLVNYMLGYVAQKDWVCPGHTGFAKVKSDKYWRAHGGKTPFPSSVEEFLRRADELAITAEIRLKQNGKYQNVEDWKAGAANDNTPVAANDDAPLHRYRTVGEELDDEIPF